MVKQIKELLNFSIINIDKPTGPTSFTVSEHVMRQLKEFGIGKTSHFGTLDPKVTGVLPIAIGRACKLTGFFLGHDKEYIGIMHIHKDISKEEVQKAIDKKFIGKITQLPPIKSRVKRAERVREIKRFEILEQDDKDFLFIAEVEGGTYIRKLIHDLGEELGVGAHMLELRRIRAGIFKEPSISLYDFVAAVQEAKKGNEKPLREMLTPGEEALKQVLPVVEVKPSAVKQLHTGKPLFKKDLVNEVKLKKVNQRFPCFQSPERLKKDDVFAVFCGERLIEIAKRTDEREIFARSVFVKN